MSKTVRVRPGAVARVKTKRGDQNSVPAGSVDTTKLAGDVISLLLPTGARIGFTGTTAPTGWVMASGRTLGNALSGATERAAEDTRNLFILLWNSYSNSVLPVSGGRGASAELDFDANKTITLPDYRGRTGVGKDDMGGSAANRVTVGGSGIAGNTMGANGGSQTNSHGHTLGASGNNVAIDFGGGNDGSVATSLHSHSVSAPTDTNNMQPSIVELSIIKL